MSAPVYPLDQENLTIETDKAKDIAAQYAEAYQSATPYNHICIDNFLPVEVLEQVRADLGTLPETATSFDRAQERF